jgi:hypothetical protein
MTSVIELFIQKDDAVHFRTLPHIPHYSLSMASRYGAIKIIQMVFDKNPSIVTDIGTMHQSFVNAAECGHVEGIEILLKHGLPSPVKDCGGLFKRLVKMGI